MYVQTVLDVHKKYNALVMSAFNNDAGFVAALDKVGMLAYGSAGLRSLHKQQRSYQNGSVI